MVDRSFFAPADLRAQAQLGRASTQLGGAMIVFVESAALLGVDRIEATRQLLAIFLGIVGGSIQASADCDETTAIGAGMASRSDRRAGRSQAAAAAAGRAALITHKKQVTRGGNMTANNHRLAPLAPGERFNSFDGRPDLDNPRHCTRRRCGGLAAWLYEFDRPGGFMADVVTDRRLLCDDHADAVAGLCGGSDAP